MKEIKLTKGKYAIVDDEDYEFLNKYKWHACNYGGKWYAGRKHYKKIYIHNEIMNPPTGMQVDHINRNGLDNRRCNLRICTKNQNQKNKSNFGKSKYHGVSLFSCGKCKASIQSDKLPYYLGSFNTEIEAALAYDRMAILLHGEYANLNFPDLFDLKNNYSYYFPNQ